MPGSAYAPRPASQTFAFMICGTQWAASPSQVAPVFVLSARCSGMRRCSRPADTPTLHPIQQRRWPRRLALRSMRCCPRVRGSGQGAAMLSDDDVFLLDDDVFREVCHEVRKKNAQQLVDWGLPDLAPGCWFQFLTPEGARGEGDIEIYAATVYGVDSREHVVARALRLIDLVLWG